MLWADQPSSSVNPIKNSPKSSLLPGLPVSTLLPPRIATKFRTIAAEAAMPIVKQEIVQRRASKIHGVAEVELSLVTLPAYGGVESKPPAR
jgi:hypothetical protein